MDMSNNCTDWKMESHKCDRSNDFEQCEKCLNDISPYNTNVLKEGKETTILCNKCYNEKKEI